MNDEKKWRELISENRPELTGVAIGIGLVVVIAIILNYCFPAQPWP